MTGAFLISGAILLPLDVFLWRLLGGFIVLVIGFTLFSLGGVGGGDAKFAAAMALFIDHNHTASFLLELSMFALLGVILHKVIGKLGFMNPITDNWESWRIEKTTKKKNFPLGLGKLSSLHCVNATIRVKTYLIRFRSRRSKHYGWTKTRDF
jgi:prepilin peptidase CpaA